MMAVPTSDEDKYANESFEADSDVTSDYGSPEIRSDSDLENRQRQTGPKNMALLASTRDRQMKLHGMMGGYPRNKDSLPFDSSSDDDDVVFSETVAEINTGSMAFDNFSTHSRRISIMQQIVETTEDDSDFPPNAVNKMTTLRRVEESTLVSDVSEELEMDMEMQVYKNQAHLVPPQSFRDYQNQEKPVTERTGSHFLHNLTNKIQQELNSKNVSMLPNMDSVAKMVAQAMSQLSIDENSTQYNEPTTKDELENQTATPDLTNLRGSPSYTVLRPPTTYKNALYRNKQMPQNYDKNMSNDIDQNLDSPKHYKSAASKLQDISSHIETETCQETESDSQYYERKMELQRNKSDSNSFRSAASDQRFKPARSSTSCKSNNQTKSGQSTRKSWTFSNDRMRQIEHENRILLQKILTQKPTVPKPNKPTKYQYLPPSTFVSNAAIDRKKKQRQIDLENQILKRKLESVTYRRKPLSIE